ncbi:unnamed protein product [Gemmataceae bacterium]|nr:unnamed protein product [Gemmataceae bacterium]VTT98911.1 unnamed protein product [Gemmataceae bacterium]
MTYLSERTMTTLAAFVEATACEVWDDARVRLVTPRGNWEPLGEEIDELVGRGWLRCDGDRVEATEAGRYWCRRWLAQPKGNGR